jgi:hypothetical protein
MHGAILSTAFDAVCPNEQTAVGYQPKLAKKFDGSQSIASGAAIAIF